MTSFNLGTSQLSSEQLPFYPFFQPHTVLDPKLCSSFFFLSSSFNFSLTVAISTFSAWGEKKAKKNLFSVRTHVFACACARTRTRARVCAKYIYCNILPFLRSTATAQRGLHGFFSPLLFCPQSSPPHSRIQSPDRKIKFSSARGPRRPPPLL